MAIGVGEWLSNTTTGERLVAAGVGLGLQALVLGALSKSLGVKIGKHCAVPFLILALIATIVFVAGIYTIWHGDGMCDYNQRTNSIQCDDYGTKKTLMNWNKPKPLPKEIVVVTDDKTGFNQVGNKFYKQSYIPETTIRSCPDGYSLADSGASCEIVFPDGGRVTEKLQSCAQTTGFPEEMIGMDGVCRASCKPGYKWSLGRCVRVCRPDMEDKGTYCKSLTVSRSGVPSKVAAS